MARVGLQGSEDKVLDYEGVGVLWGLQSVIAVFVFLSELCATQK